MDKNQLKRIQKAYDATLTDHRDGIDPWAGIPKEFINSPEFQAFEKDADPALTGSQAPDIREFLDPQPETCLLDAGCCSNLASYRFDTWPSMYFGIDVSPALLAAMLAFADENKLSIGGLTAAQITDIPFPDDFFDIAMLIGVLEYVNLEYTQRSIKELHRVLKPSAKLVLDIPNLDHPLVNVMFTLEDYLGRPHIIKSHDSVEKALVPFFEVKRIDSAHSMRKYFVINTSVLFN